MKIAHVLRKYHPGEWGGTETYVWNLVNEMRLRDHSSVLFCPRSPGPQPPDELFTREGFPVRRFDAFMPVLGLNREQRKAAISVGGNILSWSAPWLLLKEPGIHLIHIHALKRLGGIARTVARLRGLPYVVSIHGGVMDLPGEVEELYTGTSGRILDWGKPFGLIYGSRRLLEDANAIITGNPVEAGFLEEEYPDRRVVSIPHGIATATYEEDQGRTAMEAFPSLADRRFLLVVGRIDPVKNPTWVVEQFRAVSERNPGLALVLAGPVTDGGYGARLDALIRDLGLTERVLCTGHIPHGDPRLTGLYQKAEALVLPSISETFGLVLIEAWAAGTAVIATETSGARELVQPGVNGFLYPLNRPQAFHEAVDRILGDPDLREGMARSGREMVRSRYDRSVSAALVMDLYGKVLEDHRR